MRRFNVTGLCIPEEDYMVDISGKIEQIRKLIDERRYFTINRGRQYGKTTTLLQLEKALRNDYIVASMSFENLGEENFASAEVFCGTFARLIDKALKTSYVSEEIYPYKPDDAAASFQRLSRFITEICMDKKIVLMIDEVDKPCNFRIYLHFLAMLRDKFLARKSGEDYTFHSVILAGVYDVRNIKLKMINEGMYTPTASEGKIYNSPWNIAIDFDVDMTFNPADISTMLREYEKDHNTGMDITAISDEIYSYTGGYPFLVSRLCLLIDEKLNKDWTSQGIQEAVKIILMEKNTLFDDMFKNFENNKELYDFTFNLLYAGAKTTFCIDNPIVELGSMYGYFKRDGQNKVAIANRIFEIRITNYFISKTESSRQKCTGVLQEDVMNGDRFDMALCMNKFKQYYAELYNEKDIKFFEREGRFLFILFLCPLLNGQGFYHIESQFTDSRRMDLVVEYNQEQFIIELKVWRGEAGHEKAYEQLAGYLDSKNASVGYLLTFDFRKDKPLASEGMNKLQQAQWVDYKTPEGRSVRIYDVVV